MSLLLIIEVGNKEEDREISKLIISHLPSIQGMVR
jgi:hypothetical protein